MIKSGFVSVIGRANVGKSTLMQKIIGEKISIISPKAQTTRNNIKIIYNDDDSQIIFIDTPGIQIPKNQLQDYLLKMSKQSYNYVDCLVFIVDHSLEIGKLDHYILDMLNNQTVNKILLINKIDLISKEELQSILDKYESLDIFDEIIPISALNGTKVDEFIQKVKKYLPYQPRFYDEDMITDRSERFIVSEIIREKALKRLGQEIPHGISVEIESFKKREDKDIIDIFAKMICEKESHKQIIIGKKGSKIKQIGTDARLEIEIFLDSKINLKLMVKVIKNWRKNRKMVEKLGYTID